jgi:polar amino acid transport system substrate-binding protein
MGIEATHGPKFRAGTGWRNGNRVLAGALGLVACLAWAIGLGDSALAQGARVRVSDNDWPPYFFGSIPNSLPGAAKEVLTACLPRTGLPFTFQHFPLVRMTANMQSGALDVAVYSHKVERETSLHYGDEPLFAEAYRPIVRTDSEIVIRQISDFDRFRLGHQAGLVYSDEFSRYIQARQRSGTLDITTENESNIRKLTAGLIDVFVNIESTVRWDARRIDLAERVKVLDFDVQRADYFVTVSRASPRIGDKAAFVASVDACIRDLKTDGRYDAIFSRYR